MSETNYQFYPGRIKIDEVVISNTVSKVDVTDLFVEMNLNAFITGDTTSVEIVIMDSSNVFTKYSLRGGDNVSVSVSTNDSTKVFNLKIKNIKDITNMDSQKAYVLECVSHFAFQSYHKGIIKAYEGTITGIAREIFNEYTTDTDKIGHFEESSNSAKYVIPNWSVIYTLNWLAAKAVWPKDNVRYRFFQDSSLRYNFIPLELGIELYKEKPAFKYTHNLIAATKGEQQAPNSEATYKGIRDLTFEDSFDLGASLLSGDITGEILNANLTKKTYNRLTFNYFEEFSKDKHLNDYPQYKPDIYENAKTIYDLTTSKLHNLDSSNRSVDTSKIYYSRLNNSQVINITVVGNPVIEVGTVIEIEVAAPETNNEKNTRIDTGVSGLYYVIGKRDVYKVNEHEMHLSLAKESQIESIEQ
tara:strand:- start:731 stop:1972 length:1242 start_codon:yes stop_codon:yes gene_type:complete